MTDASLTVVAEDHWGSALSKVTVELWDALGLFEGPFLSKEQLDSKGVTFTFGARDVRDFYGRLVDRFFVRVVSRTALPSDAQKKSYDIEKTELVWVNTLTDEGSWDKQHYYENGLFVDLIKNSVTATYQIKTTGRYLALFVENPKLAPDLDIVVSAIDEDEGYLELPALMTTAQGRALVRLHTLGNPDQKEPRSHVSVYHKQPNAPDVLISKHALPDRSPGLTTELIDFKNEIWRGTIRLRNSSGRNGIEGAIVELRDAEDTRKGPFRSMVTDSNGEARYEFTFVDLLNYFGRYVDRFYVRAVFEGREILNTLVDGGLQTQLASSSGIWTLSTPGSAHGTYRSLVQYAEVEILDRFSETPKYPFWVQLFRSVDDPAENEPIDVQQVDSRGMVTFRQFNPSVEDEFFFRYVEADKAPIDLRSQDAPAAPNWTPEFPSPGFQTFTFHIDRQLDRESTSTLVVRGRVLTEDGLEPGNLLLLMYHVGFGGSEVQLGDVETNSHGEFEFRYDEEWTGPINLQIRSIDPNSQQEVAISVVKHAAGPEEKLNLIIPSAFVPLTSEYDRLTAAILQHLSALSDLEDARENDDRKDLTTLHHATGWDARLIGLLVQAVRVEALSEPGIGANVWYGVFRFGLPMDVDKLLDVSGKVFELALSEAINTDIISSLGKFSSLVVADFQEFKQNYRRQKKLAGGTSTVADFLSENELTPGEKGLVEKLYFEDRLSGEELWSELSQDLSPEKIDALRTQGTLAFLTHNSVSVSQTLEEEVKAALNKPDVEIDDLKALVELKYYTSQKWLNLLDEVATDLQVNLEDVVPAAYLEAFDDVSTAAGAYASDMASRVRRSFPTLVVADEIVDWNPQLEATTENAQKSLRNAEELGFELGRVPVERFFDEHEGDILQGITGNTATEIKATLKRLGRLYQTTPSDHALKVLLNNGFSSAREITTLGVDTFLQEYGSEFEDEEQAYLVYEKAEQVTSVTQNVVATAQMLQSRMAVYAWAGSQEDLQASTEALIQQFPTLESLFGSLDYCECTHCRSVLSPAAYFVDLLQYLDPEDKVWQAFLSRWQERHNEPYMDDWTPDAPEKTPYTALIERRPDLEHLELSCENTHTELPYIDVVNEILEYFVVHGTLSANTVQNITSERSAELLSEPHHVNAAAYEAIKSAIYPLDLPYDNDVETIRALLSHLNSSFGEVLDEFRTTEELNSEEPGEYGRKEVFREQLGLSAAEYNVFTTVEAHGELSTLKWHHLFGFGSNGPDLEYLSTGKGLARRLNVSYQELVTLFQTQFVNPKLSTLVTLRKMGLQTSHAISFLVHDDPGDPPEGYEDYPALTPEDHKAVRQVLQKHDAEIWLQEVWANGDFDEILVLFSPDYQCTFDNVEVRYANGEPIEPVDFLRLNLFVRLWKKLSWSPEEVDAALVSFWPTGVNKELGTLASGFEAVLLYVAHLEELIERGRGYDRRKLVTFWSDISTTGLKPLYQELFLSPRILNENPIFDHPLGRYLQYHDDTAEEWLDFFWSAEETEEDRENGKVSLAAHLTEVQSVLGLTYQECLEILRCEGLTLEKAALSVANVSILYRYKQLSELLNLPVGELASLIMLSGLDPFRPVDSTIPTEIDDDHPFETLRFVEVARLVKQSPFAVGELKALVTHRFSSPGLSEDTFRPSVAVLLQLSQELQRIEREYQAPEEPAADLIDARVVELMSLLLPADAVDTFAGLWTGDSDFDVAQREEWFDTYLKQTSEIPSFGFLAEQDLDAVFWDSEEDPPTQAWEDQRRELMAEKLFPHLRRQLRYKATIRTLTSTLGVEQQEVETWVRDTRVLAEVDEADRVAIWEVLSTTKESGVTIYEGEDAHLSPTVTLSGLTATDNVRFETYLQVAHAGAYRFFVQLTDVDEASCEIYIDDREAPELSFTAGAGEQEESVVIELEGGAFHHIRLVLSNLPTEPSRDVALFIKGEKQPKTRIDALGLHPHHVVARAQRAWMKLGKALRVAQGLSFSRREILFFAFQSEDFADFDWADFPVETREVDEEASIALFGQILRLLTYAGLRDELSGEHDDLIRALELAHTVEGQEDAAERVAEKFAPLMDTEADEVVTVLEALESDQEVSQPQYFHPTNEVGVRRLLRVIRRTQQLGVAVSNVVRWAQAAPDATVTQDVRDAMKARYGDAAWLSVARTVFDGLRTKRRDALVSYLLEELGYERPEQLFEHFLVDPEMEPVVTTSRLRLAISSVQLFIQRCFLNLEPRVDPSALNAEHWQWMKRYRLWEANRKIFLYPENYLEPEFRHNKSHLFTDLEGALLQDDVSDEVAERAFLQYVKSLERLARLEIVSMFHEEDQAGRRILHVIGRTYSLPHKYYYRRQSHGAWTPWEPIDLDIEGDHVVPVIWRERLHIFWVTFLKKAETDKEQTVESSASKSINKLTRHQVDVFLHWTEYYEGKWQQREGADFDRPITEYVTGEFERSSVRIYVEKKYDAGQETSLDVHLFSPHWARPARETVGNAQSAAQGNILIDTARLEQALEVEMTYQAQERFEALRDAAVDKVAELRIPGNFGNVQALRKIKTYRLENKSSSPRATTSVSQLPQVPISGRTIQATGYTVSGTLRAENYRTIFVDDQEHAETAEQVILGRTRDFSVVAPSNPPTGNTREVEAERRDFVVQDSRHTFFVTPVVRSTTLKTYNNWIVRSAADHAGNEWDETLTITPHVPEREDRRSLFQAQSIEKDWVHSKYRFTRQLDWLSNPFTALEFDGVLILPRGGLVVDLDEPVTQELEQAVRENFRVIGKEGKKKPSS